MISFVMSLTFSLSLLGASAQVQELNYSQLLERTYDLRYLCEMPGADERSEQLHLAVVDGTIEYTLHGPAVITRVYIDDTQGSFSIDFGAEQRLNVDLSDIAKLSAAPLAVSLGNATVISLPLTIAKDATLTLNTTSATRLDLDIWYPGGDTVLQNSSDKFLRGKRNLIKRAVTVLVDNRPPATLANPSPKKTGAAYLRSPELPPSSTNGEFRWIIRGAGVMRWFELRFIHKDAPAPIEELLRSLVLRIEHGCKTIEDEGHSITEIPLGDFFSSYRGANPSNNYLLGYNEETQTFYCRLPIPYRDNIRLSIASDITAPARFVMTAGVDKLPLPMVPPLTLHSNFSRAVGSDVASAAQLKVEGVVRLIGAMFSFTSPSSQDVVQDNDFAFAGSSNLASIAHSEQVLLREGPGVFGNNSFMRWYNIAGPTSLSGIDYKPNLKLASDVKTDYSFSTWWYGTLESRAPSAVTYPVSQRLHAANPQPTFFAIEGAIETEHDVNPRMSKGSTTETILVDDSLQVSAMQFTRWTPSDSTQAVIFDFGISESGKFDFKVQLMTGPNYGKVQVIIDGQSIGEEIDCHATVDGVSGLLELGNRRMMARERHTIGFRSLDEKAIGIDCYVVKATK